MHGKWYCECQGAASQVPREKRGSLKQEKLFGSELSFCYNRYAL